MSSSSRKRVTRKPHTATKPTSCRRRALRGDGQLVNRLFHGPLRNDHFELGVGRNLSVPGTFWRFRHPSEVDSPSKRSGSSDALRLWRALSPKAWLTYRPYGRTSIRIRSRARLRSCGASKHPRGQKACVFNCDEQIVNRLFHGPFGNEHFELGAGRNLGASDTLCS